MGFKKLDTLSLKERLLDTDNEFSCFLGRWEDGENMFDLRSQKPLTQKEQEKIDKINHNLDLINDKEYRFFVRERINDGWNVNIFLFFYLDRLDDELFELDNESQCEVPTAQCVLAYKPLCDIVNKFFSKIDYVEG